MKDGLGALLVGAVVFALAFGLLFYERDTSNGSPYRPSKQKTNHPRPC